MASAQCGRRGARKRYCRLKDFRRIATRYDKLARSYFSALCLVAAVVFWL
jgi:transposase